MGTLVVGLVTIAVGASLVWCSWIASQHRIAPGCWFGIRLAALRRSDDAWFRGHEAAAGPLGVTGGVVSACGLGVLATGLDVIGAVLVALAAVALLVGLICTLVVAGRSAAAESG